MPVVPPLNSSVDYVNETKRACPQCDQTLDRIRRRPIDRLTSLFAPVQRYRCRGFACRWEGNLKVLPQEAQVSSMM